MSEKDKVEMWEADRQAHQEEYYTKEQIPGVMAEIREMLGWGMDVWEKR